MTKIKGNIKKKNKAVWVVMWNQECPIHSVWEDLNAANKFIAKMNKKPGIIMWIEKVKYIEVQCEI